MLEGTGFTGNFHLSIAPPPAPGEEDDGSTTDDPTDDGDGNTPSDDTGDGDATGDGLSPVSSSESKGSPGLGGLSLLAALGVAAMVGLARRRQS